jgi:hypothetical protein
MERKAGDRRPGGGGGRDGRLRIAALANGRAAVRVLGSASLRADAVDHRRASCRVGSISVQNEGGGRAVADAGGARVEGATIETAWRRGTASRSRSLFFARRRRRVRLPSATCSRSEVRATVEAP